MHSGHESKGGRNLNHLELPAEVERNESNWIRKLQAILNELKSVIKHAQPITLSVNCYELLNNLKEPTMIKQNQDQKNKNATDNRKERALAIKSISYHH